MYSDFLDFHSYFMDAQRIPFIVVAIFISALVGMVSGPLAGNANPFMWIVFDKAFGWFGDRIDRKNRKKADLLFRGMIFIIVILSFLLVVLRPLSALCAQSAIAEGIVVTLCVSTGAVWYTVLKLYFTVEKQGSVKGGYYGLSRSARVNLNTTDDYGIIREGLAFSAISFDKGLIAPSLWYLIGGVPFLVIYSALSFAAWRFGKSGFTRGFGAPALALEKLMGYVPSLFAGLLYTAATVVAPSASIMQGFKSWWQAKDKVPYEQGGVMLSALAWPLSISLGGAVQNLSGDHLKKVWVGPKGASAKVENYHLKRGIVMNAVAHLLYILALLSAYLYAGQVL